MFSGLLSRPATPPGSSTHLLAAVVVVHVPSLSEWLTEWDFGSVTSFRVDGGIAYKWGLDALDLICIM